MNLNNTDYKLTMYKKYIIGLFTLCCAGNAAAQSFAQAKQLFLNGEFEQAKPAFQKLVKQAPSNANYNYWYGACCYETGEKKEAHMISNVVFITLSLLRSFRLMWIRLL